MNGNKLTRLANMAKVFQLVTTATSAFAITGYYVGNQTLFLACSIVSAVLSIGLIIGLAVTTTRLSWVASFAICLFAVLILIIGMLIDRTVMPGFLLGASILGLSMLGFGRIATYLFKSRLQYIQDKHDLMMEGDEEESGDFLDPDVYPKNLVERVARMEEASKRVENMLVQLNQGLDSYSQVQHEIEILEKYLDSKQWRADFEAEEAGKLPADMPRGVLSEDGLYNLLNRVEDAKERFVDIVRDMTYEEA